MECFSLLFVHSYKEEKYQQNGQNCQNLSIQTNLSYLLFPQ